MNIKSKSAFKALLLAAGVSLGLGATTLVANAATFDFGAIAEGSLGTTPEGNNTDAEGNWNNVVPILNGNLSTTLVIDGIGLVAQGFNNGGPNGSVQEVDAFLDSNSGGPGGLGVCSSASCTSGVSGAITSDDNVSGNGGGEFLKLTFDVSVIFDPTAFEFRKGNHGLLGTVATPGMININGIAATIINGLLSGPSQALLDSLTGTMHTFTFTGDEFYLTSATVTAVPIPAALPLFSGALGLMGFLGWRRRRASAA